MLPSPSIPFVKKLVPYVILLNSSVEYVTILLELLVAVALYPLFRWNISPADAFRVVPYSNFFIFIIPVLPDAGVVELASVIPEMEGVVTV